MQPRDGEGADDVREGEPERHERQHPRREAHLSQQRPGHENQRDGREHALEVRHGGHRVQRLHGGGLHGGTVGEVVRRGREVGLPHEVTLAATSSTSPPGSPASRPPTGWPVRRGRRPGHDHRTRLHPARRR